MLRRVLFSTKVIPINPLSLNPTTTTATSAISKEAKETGGGELEAYRVSGAPTYLTERTVRIYQPAKSAMQSAHRQEWKLDFDILAKAQRWENPLMGWASSGDPVQALSLDFRSKEEAIQFVQKQGWAYQVEEVKERRFKKKVYADNFTFQKQLRIIRTK